MAAQFKWPPKFDLLLKPTNPLLAPIFNMAFFWHLFLEALAFVRNFKMQKFLHFLEEKIQKFFFFKMLPKINKND
jgi:hypothetical protein